MKKKVEPHGNLCASQCVTNSQRKGDRFNNRVIYHTEVDGTHWPQFKWRYTRKANQAKEQEMERHKVSRAPQTCQIFYRSCDIFWNTWQVKSAFWLCAFCSNRSSFASLLCACLLFHSRSTHKSANSRTKCRAWLRTHFYFCSLCKHFFLHSFVCRSLLLLNSFWLWCVCVTYLLSIFDRKSRPHPNSLFFFLALCPNSSNNSILCRSFSFTRAPAPAIHAST